METPNHELEDLINHTNALKCSDPSSSFPPLLLPPPSVSVSPPSLTLAGKIMSLKSVSSSSIKTNLLQAWHFLKSLTSEYKENNLVVFTFEDDADLSRVLDNSPWNIKGSPLFLQRWENDDTFEDLDFSKGAFWIQVHGLPLEWMTTENASSIGNSLGVLLEVDNADKLKPNRKGFLRIRVLINLKEPLATGFLHHRPPKAPAKIQYQYERLSDFCYACGRLGHL
jgi:hypothetical protein